MRMPFRSARPTRPTRSWTPLAVLASLATAVAVLAFSALAASASPDADPLLTPAETLALHGGTCSTCGSDSGGSDPADDEPSPRGSAYWVTRDQVLSSYDPGVAEIVHRYNNWDDRELRHTFDIERRVVRRVGFSGGYADYVRLSIGGEVDRTWRQSTEKVLDPWEGLKVYRRQETRRYTVYGTRYQDYDDGSRKVVARSSGPYTTSNSVFGYVTYALR